MNHIFKTLKSHIGHNISCVAYGDINNPHDICVECKDCCEVLISAESFDETDSLEDENET